MTKEEQIHRLSNEYLSAFLGFAIKKLGNITEGEELAQEITYQCIVAINKGNITDNFNSYLWSIAHNTFKRWCKQKSKIDYEGDINVFSNIVGDDFPILEQLIYKEEANGIRIALSRLSMLYRKVMVYFYYHELTIHDIGEKLNISEGMVKFYLRTGKEKLKEAFYMNQVGDKSFNPSEFAIYKSGIDFSKVNVWEVFKRKLPCQIAIICHDEAKTISEMSNETGTPSVYIEDEVKLLLDAGVILTPVKDKYRTNFYIMKQTEAINIKNEFIKLFETYVPRVIDIYNKYLPNLKDCDIFKFNASNNQWAWFFAKEILDFDYDGFELSVEDYPEILSCGSKSIIFAEETKGSPWSRGQTPTVLETCIVHPCDVVIFGDYHRQKEFRDKYKAQVLYDIYCGSMKEEDVPVCAELIAEGYVIRVDGKLYCNIPVTTKKSRQIFDEINLYLSKELKVLCVDIRKRIYKLIKANIPEQLAYYTKGYTETWISFYARNYLLEALYDKGFIKIPDKEDLTPVACWIYEK